MKTASNRNLENLKTHPIFEKKKLATLILDKILARRLSNLLWKLYSLIVCVCVCVCVWWVCVCVEKDLKVVLSWPTDAASGRQGVKCLTN